jgi:predicted metalloprotease with PDZ domain
LKKAFVPNSRFTLASVSLAVAQCLAGAPAWGQTGALALSAAAYPGVITLDVDLRDTTRKVFNVHEVIPVKPGAMTLRYPKWIPGEHSPSGTLDGVTGVKISAGGKRIAWRRDLSDMYALNLQVPEGATRIDVDFQFLSPVGGGNFGQSASATPRLAELEWNQVAFYPAGYAVAQITVQPSIRVPEGWQFATSLEADSSADGKISFKPLSFEMLVDSPLFTGKHFKRIDLAPGAKRPVYLNVVADRAANLDIKPAQIQGHQALVKQAVAMFGAEHYQHYDFLLAVSDHTGGFGLEHHQSSDDRVGADFFTDPDLNVQAGSLLPHEYVHSWNGKFRRPAGLATADYNAPMKGDLLWVYEGLTEYLGNVLAARSGLWSTNDYREQLAITAAAMNHVPGRSWRPLQDTADEAQVLYFTPRNWSSWRRSVDFYPEGELLWLDVDTRIRELSGAKRSLDDFLHAFHGVQDGVVAVLPYSFDDVVNTLNAVQPNDWAAFLRQRLDSVEPGAPLDGLKRAGWKLAYGPEPTKGYKGMEKSRKQTDRSYSVGLVLGTDDNRGQVADVLWGSPAFEAGLAPGMKLVAVNGDDYSSDALDAAITEAAATRKPMELLVKSAGNYWTLRLPYFGGQVFPRLERVDGTPERLEALVKAK